MPKRDLIFSKPFLNAAGTLGFVLDPRAPVSWNEFGAFITSPVSFRPRRAAAAPAVLEFPGGFLLHTGLPNPGFTAALRRYGHRWRESPLPVIVHLMADRPEETRQIVQALESAENIMAVELGFAPLLAPDILALAVEMCRGELPLIVSLPAEHLLDLGGRMLELGVAALSLACPRGVLRQDRQMIRGRLLGRAMFPRSLELVDSAARLGFPVIGAGGVYSREDAQAMLDVGAMAVQIDAALWLPAPAF